jgi:diketogulonate reductase-like aldo/keto reductase
VKFPTGAVVPVLGQGSAGLGQGRHPAAEEEEALRTGLSLGMTLIDTSGDYGEGRSEELIKRVIAGQRDRAFVVSKVEANDVARGAMARACEASLSRLGTDYLDLYLLHWPVSNAHFPDANDPLQPWVQSLRPWSLRRRESANRLHRVATVRTLRRKVWSPS